MLIAVFVLSIPMIAQEEFSSSDIFVKTKPARKNGLYLLVVLQNLYDTTAVVTFHYTGMNDVPVVLQKNETFKKDCTFDRITAHVVTSPSKEVEIFRSPTLSSMEKNEKKTTEENPSTPGAQTQLHETASQEKPTAPAIQPQPVAPATQNKPTSLTTQIQPSAPTTQQKPAEQLSSNESVNTTAVHDSMANASDTLQETQITTADAVLQPEKAIPWKMIGVIAGVVLISLLLLLWYIKTNRAQRNQQKNVKRPTSSGNDTDSFLVVGRKTQTILKRQTLDDVYDNETYIKIESSDFCQDSAVRAMYLKNTCIKDIYNMYAEDLRNPDNPKEDGCMVLGRWVLDEASQQYDVTLEHIVLPGDDAVFDEYELNFGGKIKLKISEKLRKLRRDTDMQYDLTCWVHSHPGLGVFFSNYDESVHLQLKHPTHPKFLTALVVDILTPQLETGIFTFRQDMTVNSKSDIKKMYSFEELYQRALESERNSFDPTSHYDILGKSREHQGVCYGIQLSNGAIIDMTFLAAKPTGFVTYAHGYTIKRGERTQCIVTTVSRAEAVADNKVIGCFVVAPHCSVPSIRKVVAPYLHYIHFVLVYTADDGLLTAIPVVNKDLYPDTAYHGEQKLEELKIWTRRKR